MRSTTVHTLYPVSSSSHLLKAGLLALLLANGITMAQPPPPLTTVPHVDLDRYTGEWYEIARYPNRFEKECDSDVIAVYSQHDDGKIQVVNSCRKSSGAVKESSGYVKVVDKKTNGKLKVPAYGNYWIVDLDPDYRYAVVSEPRREYLWILSRTPQMNPAHYEQLMARIRQLGFDPARLIRPKQTLPTK